MAARRRIRRSPHVEDDTGRKAVKRVGLQAKTAAEAQEAFRTLLVELSGDRLRQVADPRFSDYVEQTYEKRLATSGKKPDTLVTEHVHLKQVRESIGHLSLDKDQSLSRHGPLAEAQGARQGQSHLQPGVGCFAERAQERQSRRFLKSLPVEGIPWQRSEKKARRLFTRAAPAAIGVDVVPESKAATEPAG